MMFFETLFVLALLALSSSSCEGVDTNPQMLTIRVTLVRPRRSDNLPKVHVTKDAKVFGRELDDQSMLVDSKSLGLANVFVWTTTSGRGQGAENRRLHHVVLANGQYAPRAHVAAAGDRLEFLFIDPVADRPRASHFQPLVTPHSNSGIETAFKLADKVDEPVRLESAIYPWLTSWVFVQEKCRCAITNRFGECFLPITEDSGERGIQLVLWHEKLGHPRIMRLSPGATSPKPGHVSVDEPASRAMVEAVLADDVGESR
jgi:hypothetical protein